MPWTFNPFSGTFDQKGSGGGGGSAFFAGEVATYADLPLDGTAALNSRWLVRTNSGTWPFSSYKQSGIYIRTATVGSSRDNDYKLTDTSFHDVMSDDAFLIFDNADPTKAAKFDVGAQVGANQTRVITVPNKNITLDDAGDSRTPTSHTHTGSQVNVGTTANLPLRTGTNGVIEAGSFGTAAGSFCEGNDARLSDARTPSSTLAHAASHAAGAKAYFAGQVGGMTTSVIILANNEGTAGNNISLSFDGVDDIDTVISDWNIANSSNTATIETGDGTQVPDSGESITLTGGINQGGDPIANPVFDTVGLGISPTGSERKFHQHGGKFTVESSSGGYGQFQVINPSAGEVSFVLATEAVANEDGTITSQTAAQTWAFGTGSYSNSATTFVIGNNEGGSVFHVLPDGKVGLGSGNNDPAEALDIDGNIALRDTDNDFAATFDVQEQLSGDVTLTIPDQSGTLAVVTDIPTTAGDVGAVAAGAITTSGLTQATARILGRTSASTGAVEEIQIGSGLSLSAGELSATSSGGISAVGASTADVLSVSGSDLVADDPNADRIVFWDDSESKLRYLEAGSGLSISGTTMTATASGGIGGGTGSTDNSILRSDGTGGSTLQDSAFIIADNATASPNNTVNHASIQATGGTTNVSVSIVPKGTGAFMLQVPDGTSTGGNARGANAIDLQTSRTSATQVASGSGSVCIGRNCSTAHDTGIAIGLDCSTSSGNGYGVAIGRSNAVNTTAGAAIGGQQHNISGREGFIGAGSTHSVSGAGGAIIGGEYGVADRAMIQVQSCGRFAASGDAQRISVVLRGKTTTNTAVELLTAGFITSSTRLTIPSGKVMAMLVNITGVKSDGSAVAHYVRQYAIKNVGGTTSEVYAPVTIGTDNAVSTSIAISANDTNDALKIECTGIASETWRWVASVDAVEVAYGT